MKKYYLLIFTIICCLFVFHISQISFAATSCCSTCTTDGGSHTCDLDLDGTPETNCVCSGVAGEGTETAITTTPAADTSCCHFSTSCTTSGSSFTCTSITGGAVDTMCTCSGAGTGTAAAYTPAASTTTGAATTATSTTTLNNPLKEDNPVAIIGNIIRAMLGVVGAVTLLMFLYGGFMLIFSAGEQEKLEKGRKTLIWAIIGLAIVLSSYSILSYVFKILVSSST